MLTSVKMKRRPYLWQPSKYWYASQLIGCLCFSWVSGRLPCCWQLPLSPFAWVLHWRANSVWTGLTGLLIHQFSSTSNLGLGCCPRVSVPSTGIPLPLPVPCIPYFSLCFERFIYLAILHSKWDLSSPTRIEFVPLLAGVQKSYSLRPPGKSLSSFLIYPLILVILTSNVLRKSVRKVQSILIIWGSFQTLCDNPKGNQP